jgi:hypothetical protein
MADCLCPVCNEPYRPGEHIAVLETDEGRCIVHKSCYPYAAEPPPAEPVTEESLDLAYAVVEA